VSPDDQPELDPDLADAVRRAYVRPVDEAIARRHLSAIVASAGGPFPAPRRPARRRTWRALAAALAALTVLPAGLAAAGVRLPDAVEQPYRSIGIALPNQTSRSQAAPTPRPATPRPAPARPQPTAEAQERPKGTVREKRGRAERPAADRSPRRQKQRGQRANPSPRHEPRRGRQANPSPPARRQPNRPARPTPPVPRARRSDAPSQAPASPRGKARSRANAPARGRPR
jgi:hypothetical protein